MTCLLKVGNLRKTYPTQHGTVTALADVSFEIMAGKSLALVGESGCGKSTVAMSLLRLIPFDSGDVMFEGHDLSSLSGNAMRLLREKLGIVFQDPYSSLNPKHRVGKIIGEALEVFKSLKGRKLEERVAKLMTEVGLDPAHIDRYPHEFSGGQRQRIAIARALAVEPKLLILDEPTSALDVSVQAQTLNLLRDLKTSHGISYLFITHNLATVDYLADDVAVMYLGRIAECGPVDQVFRNPHHPYTKLLLDSLPGQTRPAAPSVYKPDGEIPSPFDIPNGCSFQNRCSRANETCRSVEPELQEFQNTRKVACFNPTGLSDILAEKL
ncbi:ABC transporter ATP-binding protein [Sneathiella sp.]|jgi:oligopeptide/dipeptide ABC transporter ATP-binding protein|uniref:ABC transporter ATP-binding protein n=1 Tax=Sneathiella sp. TaxID=1964365 RepID=UPI0039E4C82C